MLYVLISDGVLKFVVYHKSVKADSVLGQSKEYLHPRFRKFLVPMCMKLSTSTAVDSYDFKISEALQVE